MFVRWSFLYTFAQKLDDMRNIFILILALLVYASCRTSKSIIDTSIEKEVPITNTSIIYNNKVIRDSVYTHDSVYVFVKGDTVIKYNEKTFVKYYGIVDTLIKTDTIQVPITVTKTETHTKEVEVNILYWWQKFLIYTGLLALFSGIIISVIKIKKFL